MVGSEGPVAATAKRLARDRARGVKKDERRCGMIFRAAVLLTLSGEALAITPLSKAESMAWRSAYHQPQRCWLPD
jgi:hypothetical protein